MKPKKDTDGVQWDVWVCWCTLFFFLEYVCLIVCVCVCFFFSVMLLCRFGKIGGT